MPENAPPISAEEYARAEQMCLRMAGNWWRRNQRVLPVGFDLEDAEQVARIAVHEATGRFDPRYGVKFRTFAWCRVRGMLQHAARDFTHLPRAEYQAKRWDLLPLSLDALVGPEDGTPVMELILDPDADTSAGLLRATLWGYLECLPRHDRHLLQLRYQEEWSQLQVGEHLRLSQMTISRQERKALSRLRDLLQDDDYL